MERLWKALHPFLWKVSGYAKLLSNNTVGHLEKPPFGKSGVLKINDLRGVFCQKQRFFEVPRTCKAQI